MSKVNRTHRSVTLSPLPQRTHPRPLEAAGGAQPKLIPIAEDAFPARYKIEKIEAVVAGATVPAIVQVWATETKRRTRQRHPPDRQPHTGRGRPVASGAVNPTSGAAVFGSQSGPCQRPLSV